MATHPSPIFSYLRFVLDELEISPTELAARAGVSASTITRFLNDPSYKFTPSTRTLQKIATASGLSPAPFLTSKDFVESSLLPFVSKTLYDETWNVPEGFDATLVIGEACPGNWKEAGIRKIEHSPPIFVSLNMQGVKSTDQFAVLMRGTSMNRVALDGEHLLCVKTGAMQGSHRSGSIVIVERQVKDLPLIELSARVLVQHEGRWKLRFATTDDHFAGTTLDVDDVEKPSGLKIIGLVCYVIKATPDPDELIGLAR